MHIILTGKLDVIVADSDGIRRIVAVAHAGESVGEIARGPQLLFGGSARQSGRQCPASISACAWRYFADDNPPSAPGRHAGYRSNFGDLDCNNSCRRLTRELLHPGRTLHLTSSDIRQLVSADDPLARNEFLEHASCRYDFLIFEGEPADDAWNRVAVGFVGRVFLSRRRMPITGRKSASGSCWEIGRRLIRYVPNLSFRITKANPLP